jgi:hypothetical protein
MHQVLKFWKRVLYTSPDLKLYKSVMPNFCFFDPLLYSFTNQIQFRTQSRTLEGIDVDGKQ